MTDDEFLKAFEECRIPKALWTHEAHVRMAWLYLRERPLEEVIALVRKGIQRYNASLGNTEGYHDTVTVAYLVLIDRKIDRRVREGSFVEFSRAHPSFLDRTMSALFEHYSRDVLFSKEAIKAFVEPDLAPLPGPPFSPRG